MFRIKDQSLLILYFLTFSRYSYPHQSLPLRQIIPNSVKACSLRSILLKIFSLNSHAHFSAPLHTQPSRKVKVKLLSCIQLFATPWNSDSPWNSPGQNTRVGSCSLLQGIFLTQGSNPGLPYHRWILYQLSHKGSPTKTYFVIAAQIN